MRNNTEEKTILFNTETGDKICEIENTGLYAKECLARLSDGKIGWCVLLVEEAGE